MTIFIVLKIIMNKNNERERKDLFGIKVLARTFTLKNLLQKRKSFFALFCQQMETMFYFICQEIFFSQRHMIEQLDAGISILVHVFECFVGINTVFYRFYLYQLNKTEPMTNTMKMMLKSTKKILSSLVHKIQQPRRGHSKPANV